MSKSTCGSDWRSVGEAARLRQFHRRAHRLAGEPRSHVAKRENAESRAEFGDLGCCAEWFARRTDLRPSYFALHGEVVRDDAASGFNAMTPEPIFFRN
jgi:hypothetical protein